MRFAQHLSSHLTPEWRKHYIDYDKLKKMIYEMVGEAVPVDDEDFSSHVVGPLIRTVDPFLQEEFFKEVQRELDDINSFFRARQAALSHRLHELEGEVEVLVAVLTNPRTRQLRSTRQKHHTLKLAVSEYYLGLVLLQNFQQLNHTGFRKILKKHDKLTRSTRGGQFFKVDICQRSEFWTSKEVSKLIDKTEGMMIDKLEGGDRSKAMNRLRVPPLENRGRRSHWVTCRMGWFMGVVFVAILVIGVAIALRPSGSWEHFTPNLRGLRAGGLLTLWFYGFAINTYGFRKSGVNNVLIFEFDPRNYLNFVQLFEVSSLLAVIWCLGVAIFVFSYWLGIPGWVGPLVMFGVMAALFSLPLPLLYYRSRRWLLKEMCRVFLAPFFAVTFPDFWIADQLNSLAVIFLDIEYFVCFMVYGLHYSDYSIECGSVSYGLRAVVAVLPAWFRFAQCLRRFRDTRLVNPHLINAGKYSTSFFVVFFSSLAAGLKDSSSDSQSIVYYVAFLLWLASAIVSSCYTFAWDIKMDWGLFEGKYKLRSELIYSKKIYYVLAVVEDLIFRSLWTLNFSVGEAGASVLEGNILGSILAVLEVFRRFVWNFFRLENEHLNNCGQFRVVRDISVHPLDLSELTVRDEEEGAEPPMRHQLNKHRRMSFTLSELSGNNTRLRKNTSIARSLDSGRGSDAGMPPNLLAIQETEEADRELECAVDHRTNRDSNSVSIISSYSTAV